MRSAPGSLMTAIAMIALSTTAMSQVSLDVDGLGRVFGGWKHKGNTAAEFNSSDHKYRIYKPTASPTPSKGLLASTKLNHIRRFQFDDECQLDMEFDASGQLTSCRAQLRVLKKRFEARITAAELRRTGSGSGDIAAKIVDFIISKFPARFAPGNGSGTNHFPGVIRHCMNQLAANVLVGGRKVRRP